MSHAKGLHELWHDQLRGMLHENLYASMRSAMHSQIVEAVRGGGFFHHEVELVRLPEVSHICLMLGNDCPTRRPYPAIEGTSPLDGGIVMFLPHGHELVHSLMS